MIEPLPTNNDKVLAFKLSGKLHDADYQKFVPAIDAAAAKHGKVRSWPSFTIFRAGT